MGTIEQLAEKYGQHIAMPWQHTVAGAQRVIMVVYDKELERTLAARKEAFEIATREAGHEWFEVDVAGSFAQMDGRGGVPGRLLRIARGPQLEARSRIRQGRGSGSSRHPRPPRGHQNSV